MNKRTKNKKLFPILNILIPILSGAIFYYLSSPDVWFVEIMDRFLGIAFHPLSMDGSNPIYYFFRCYGLDMLWAYAFVFALSVMIGHNSNDRLSIFIIAVVFSTGMELLQQTHWVAGTFDVLDIVFELLAELIAFIQIKRHNRRYESYEEKN